MYTICVTNVLNRFSRYRDKYAEDAMVGASKKKMDIEADKDGAASMERTFIDGSEREDNVTTETGASMDVGPGATAGIGLPSSSAVSTSCTQSLPIKEGLPMLATTWAG